MSTPPGVSIAESGDQAPDSAPDHGHRHLGLALLVISAAQLMVVLDATIVTIALPYLKADLGFSDSGLSWVVTSYTLAFGGLLLLGGRAGDLLGRRRVFMAGVAVFALASLLGGLAQGDAWLISARVLQGLSAAVASPTALSLITTTFPAGPPRNRAFAVYAAMSGAGAAVGLILGGALTELSWRWTFFINVPIGLLALVLAPRVLGESKPQHGRFDLPGALTATGGLVSLVYGLTHAASKSWGDPVTLGAIALGVVLLAVFLAVESKSTHALMPMRILAHRNRGVTYLAMLSVGASMFAMFYFLSLYVQNVLGYSSLQAGFAFLPFSFGIVFAAQAASKLIARLDPRWISGAGGVLASGALLWMSQLEVGSSYFPSLLCPMVLMSLGMGLIFVPLTLTAVHGVDKRDSGVASAVLNTMQQVGGALGLATLATVATSSAKSKGLDLAADLQAKVASGQLSPDQVKSAGAAAGLQAQTAGFTAAFLVGSLIVGVATVLIVTLLNSRHQDLATDEPAPLG